MIPARHFLKSSFYTTQSSTEGSLVCLVVNAQVDGLGMGVCGQDPLDARHNGVDFRVNDVCMVPDIALALVDWSAGPSV